MSASSPRAWAPWCGSARFAEGLLARHARVGTGARGVGRVALRGARAAARGATRFDVRVSVRHEGRGAAVHGAGAAAGRGALARALTAGGPPPIGRYVAPAGAPSSSQRSALRSSAAPSLAQRVVARAAPARREESAAREWVRNTAPVPRIVRRGARAESDETRASTPTRTSWASASTRGAAASPLSGPELERVTARVVDAIDRRLAASRERRGRV